MIAFLIGLIALAGNHIYIIEDDMIMDIEPMSIHWTQKVESFYATSIASSSIC